MHNALQLLELVRDVPGDVAEVGVYRGDTFRMLIDAVASHKHRRVCHAFDTFTGMPSDPGEKDAVHPKGKPAPKGHYDVGGFAGFRAIMEFEGYKPGYMWTWEAWAGEIPDCFYYTGISEVRFCFAFVSVGTHDATAKALEWIWPRLNRGGAILGGCWHPGFPYCATPAYEQFMEDHEDEIVPVKLLSQAKKCRYQLGFRKI